MGTIGNTTVSGETQVKGVREVSISDNILWRGTGGDPTLTVEYGVSFRDNAHS